MRTMILDEPGKFRAADTTPPEQPGPGEALVRVRRVGVCGTDLHAYRGRQPFFTYPRILGHELGVEVMEVGQGVENVRPGDRCAVEPYLNCGHCIACRQGKTNCCVDLKVLGVHTDGGMREQIVVPSVKLHASTGLTLDQLTLVETLGIGAHAVQRSGLQPGEQALVIGTGPIGLSVIQFACAAGGRVIAMDTNPVRLAFCRDQMKTEHVVGAGEGALQTVSDITSGDLPTVVFDATGSPESMMRAFQYVAHGGRLVFVGLFQGDVTFHDPHFHRREMTLLSSRNSTAHDFRRIIALMEEGKVNTTPWITHRAALDDMISQFEGWLDPANRVLKAVIEV
jgi:2-desacetyl-2-hydroxyethyl bacteriochlorophyllide A dehydrogenase